MKYKFDRINRINVINSLLIYILRITHSKVVDLNFIGIEEIILFKNEVLYYPLERT
jgi:hypothetical protein